MAWWNRLFKKKEPIQQEEDWEQLVYTRNGVNFDEEDQRKRRSQRLPRRSTS